MITKTLSAFLLLPYISGLGLSIEQEDCGKCEPFTSKARVPELSLSFSVTGTFMVLGGYGSVVSEEILDDVEIVDTW